jgi:hypothetical protein
MGVQLRIKFTAGVAPVCGHNPVCRCPVLIRTIQPDARGSIELCLSERLPDSFVMGGNQTLITTDECQNRN